MKNFSKGVEYFTKATAEIVFPEDDVCCAWCPLMGDERGRKYCRKTGEYLTAPEHLQGYQCPLKFEKESENGQS